MENKNVNVNFNFFTVLGIAFIVLKLCNIIQWAWVWVLAPIWAPLAFWFIVFIIGFIIGILNR